MVWDLCIVSVSSLEWGQRKEMWIQPEAARKQFDEFWHAILVWPFCPHNPSCFKMHLAGCWCHTSMTSQIGSESKAHSSLQSGPIIHAGEFFLHLIWWVHGNTYLCMQLQYARRTHPSIMFCPFLLAGSILPPATNQPPWEINTRDSPNKKPVTRVVIPKYDGDLDRQHGDMSLERIVPSHDQSLFDRL